MVKSLRSIALIYLLNQDFVFTLAQRTEATADIPRLTR